MRRKNTVQVRRGVREGRVEGEVVGRGKSGKGEGVGMGMSGKGKSRWGKSGKGEGVGMGRSGKGRSGKGGKELQGMRGVGRG